MNALQMQKDRLQRIALMAGGKPLVSKDLKATLAHGEWMLARLVHQDGVGVKEVEEVARGLNALRGIYKKLNPEGM